MGIFFAGDAPRRPRGEDRTLWADAVIQGQLVYSGSTQDHPGIALRTWAIESNLVADYARNSQLRGARTTLRTSTRALQHAQGELQAVDALTKVPIHAGGQVEQVVADPHARHVRIEGSRAQWLLARAREARDQAQRDANLGSTELYGVVETLMNEMLATATTAVQDLRRYLSLLNRIREWNGQPTLEALPADFPDEIAARAARRVTPPPEELQVRA